MNRLTLQEYLNDRIKNVKYYIEFNERENDKDFFAHKELELYQMAEKYMQLTNELGCPLDIVFKAIENGIYCYDSDNEEIRRFITHFQYNSTSKEYYWYGNNIHFPNLKDYKKTWFLKGDLSE